MHDISGTNGSAKITPHTLLSQYLHSLFQQAQDIAHGIYSDTISKFNSVKSCEPSVALSIAPYAQYYLIRKTMCVAAATELLFELAELCQADSLFYSFCSTLFRS